MEISLRERAGRIVGQTQVSGLRRGLWQADRSQPAANASELHQVLRTAEKYYRGKVGLVLLEIDVAALGALVVREDLTGTGTRFPHVYGEIPLSAVARHFDFSADASGQFLLPPELVVTKYPGAAG